MTNYVKIGGNPKIGIVILGDDGTIRNLDIAHAASGWAVSPPATGITPHAKFTHISTTAHGSGGITTVASVNSLKYLTVLGNMQARWQVTKPELPANVNIAGVAGDAVDGYMLLSTDGKLYQVSADGKEWKLSTAELPFASPTAIVGDPIGGVLALNGRSEIARGTADCGGWTALKPDAPVEISLITGEAAKGFVVYGEGRLYTLDVSKGAAWAPMFTPNFNFLALSGNPVDGLVAIIGDSTGAGTIVIYNAVLAKGPWTLALAPQAPVRKAP